MSNHELVTVDKNDTSDGGTTAQNIGLGPISRRRLLQLGGLGAGAFLLAACGGSSEGDGSGGGGGEQHAEIGVLPAEGTSGHAFLVAVGDSITEQHPDFTYDYTFVNSKVRPQIEQRWRAGSPPDTDYFVFNAQVPSTHEFTSNLLELSPYLDKEIDGGGTWRESFLDSTSAVTDLDGNTYGVVTDTHLIALFYNRQIFDEAGLQPPKTWDDLLAVSAELSTTDIAPVAVTGMYEPYMGFWIDNLFQRIVGYDKALDAAFSGDYSDPGFLEAAEQLQALRDQGAFLKGFEGTDFTAVQMEFFQGKAAMILMGTWLTSEMKDSIPEGFDLGLTTFPTIPGAAGDNEAQLAHSNVMVVNKESQVIDAAIEYMRTFTSKDTQTRRALEQGAVSAVKDVPAPPDVEGLDQLLAETEKLNVRYFGLEFVPDRFTPYYHEVAKFFFGEYDAKQFIDALSTAMKNVA